MAGCLAASLLLAAAPPGEMDTLQLDLENAKRRIEQNRAEQAQAAVAAYGQALSALLASVQDKGDLDAYLVVAEEQKRFAAEGTAPGDLSGRRAALLGDLVIRYRQTALSVEQGRKRRMAALLRQFLPRLDLLIKQSTQQDKIEDAKLLKAEKDRIVGQLAEFEQDSATAAQPTAAQPPGRVTRRPAGPPPPASAKVFQGHHYQVVIGPASWPEAKAACEKRGGHLGIIESAEENDFVQKQVAGLKAAWIGLRAVTGKRDFRWVDGSRPGFTGWASFWQEPRVGDGRSAAAIWRGKQGRAGWVHLRDNHEKVEGYVCEWDS